MKNLDSLIEEGKSLLVDFENKSKNPVQGELVSRIKSLHIKGNFYLKKIDKKIHEEYSKLFAKTFTDEYWDNWNNYTRTELEKCLGILIGIGSLNPEDVIDKTMNKVFISHGKFTPYFYKIESFIKALGLLPVYDINEPTQGKSVNNHIGTLMENSDFYIILATKETVRGNQDLPNHNVIIEFDRLVQSGNLNLIVLLEDGCKMPSMVQDVIYIGFTTETLADTFIKIASELNRSGLLN